MKNLVALLLLIVILGGFFAFLKFESTPVQQNTQNQVIATKSPFALGDCVPTFLDGGGPYYHENSPLRSNIAPEKNAGEKLVVKGRVLANDCSTPVANVIVDIWQANETGNYEDEWYRGRVTSNAAGEYEFTTVVPKGYGQGTGYRPPHIHFKIWKDNQLIITSQMFLPESRTQGIEEPFIMNVVSSTENGAPLHQGSHDIILP